MGAALWRGTLVAAALVLPAVVDARAGSVTVIGNYPETSDGTLTAVASLGGSYAKAVGFTMGGLAYELDSVTLRLAQQPGSSSTLSVELMGGTASGPSGPVLVGFNTPIIPSQAGNVTFTPTVPVALEAGSSYWLEVSGQSDTLNGIVWYASSRGVTPTGVATSMGALFTSQLGTAGAMAPSSVLNTFQVTGSSGFGPLDASVPEPPGLVLGTISVLAGLLVARWRGRRVLARPDRPRLPGQPV
jgi:hypothetical protein